MNFSKAFDVVPHQRLLAKLNSYGICDNTLFWINSFLCNRRQRVLIDGSASKYKPVLSGVPQGTVLGPLLFLLYINDITVNIKSNIRIFADDCILYREIQNNNDKHLLQQDINTLYEWSKKWVMNFNSGKCYVLPISRRRKNIISNNYFLGTSSLEILNSHTYLGVTISGDLRWNNHISAIVSKATKTLNFIRRNIYMCSSESKSMAYTSLVRPILEYSCSAWDPYTSKNITEIEAVQKRAARFVTKNYDFNTSSTKLVAYTGCDNLSTSKQTKSSQIGNFLQGLL